MKVTEKLFESLTASVSVTEEMSATVSIEITLNDRNSENHSQIISHSANSEEKARMRENP